MPVRAMLHECNGSHLQFVFWQALVRFAHSVAWAQRASACGGGRPVGTLMVNVLLVKPVFAGVMSVQEMRITFLRVTVL